MKTITLLTPSAKLFRDAGLSKSTHTLWSSLSLPLEKPLIFLADIWNGWSPEDYDDEQAEIRAAEHYLKMDAQSRAEGQKTDDKETIRLGPLLTTREALQAIEEDKRAGRHASIEAFKSALHRAARTARKNPKMLPISLRGQHADWYLVELGPATGGHHGSHKLRRRL